MRIFKVRSFKHYNREEFNKDIADIPWNVIEALVDINDAVAALNRHVSIKKI